MCTRQQQHGQLYMLNYSHIYCSDIPQNYSPVHSNLKYIQVLDQVVICFQAIYHSPRIYLFVIWILSHIHIAAQAFTGGERHLMPLCALLQARGDTRTIDVGKLAG